MKVEHPPDNQTSKMLLSSNPETWIERYGDILYRFALLRLRDPKLAEDAVQETLLSALQSHDRFLGQSSEQSWLIGILKHKIIDHFRKTRRESPMEEIAPFGEESEGVFDENGHWRLDETGPAEWNADPETLLERKEFWVSLDRCLEKLPARMANVFTLREIDGVESGAVCAALNISSSNLWVLMHRARMQLRQCLETHFFGKGMKGDPA